MTNEDIITISRSISIPKCLKTENFKIKTALQIQPFSFNISCLIKYSISSIKPADLSYCINFFNSLKQIDIFFTDWDDLKQFDFQEDYETQFYLKIHDINKFLEKNCNRYQQFHLYQFNDIHKAKTNGIEQFLDYFMKAFFTNLIVL